MKQGFLTTPTREQKERDYREPGSEQLRLAMEDMERAASSSEDKEPMAELPEELLQSSEEDARREGLRERLPLRYPWEKDTVHAMDLPEYERLVGPLEAPIPPYKPKLSTLVEAALAGRQGEFGPLVELLRNGSDADKLSAAAALWMEACEPRWQARIAEAGGIEALVELEVGGSGAAAQQATATLAELMSNDADHGARIAQARERREAAASQPERAAAPATLPLVALVTGGLEGPATAEIEEAFGLAAGAVRPVCVPAPEENWSQEGHPLFPGGAGVGKLLFEVISSQHPKGSPRQRPNPEPPTEWVHRNP